MKEQIQQASTRDATAAALMQLAEKDPNVVLISTDSVLVVRGLPFKEKFPNQFVELGISEQNGVDVAAGMAACGLKPHIATYAGFLTMRACEQIRTFVAYPGLNVTLIGANGGIGAGEREGVTHQFFEDYGILRTIPGVTILVPADAGQVEKAILAADAIKGPVYIRVGSGRDPVVYENQPEFTVGKATTVLNYGNDAVIFGCGSLLARAIRAAKQLQQENINITVVDVHTIRPLDTKAICAAAEKTNTVITLEDHNINNGLGSAVCEVLSEHNPKSVYRMGVQDCFTRSGASEDLLDYYGLGVADIVKAVKNRRNFHV